MQSIAQVAIVVRDYDRSSSTCSGSAFVLIEDRPIETESKRRVIVAPPGSSESRLLLA